MKKLLQFCRNIWAFKKALWHFRWWDYCFILEMLETSLKIMEKGFREKGIEEETSRALKVEKINRARTILKNIQEDNYVDMVEPELGKIIPRGWILEEPDNSKIEEREHNSKILKRAWEIEKAEWNELWTIFSGKAGEGSDMRGWWD